MVDAVVVRYRLVWLSLAATCLVGADLLHAQPQFASPPTVALLPDSPLAGVLQFSTDVPSRVSFEVRGPGEAWRVHSNNLATDHALPLLGLAPDREYVVAGLTLQGAVGQSFQSAVSLPVATDPLPADFPNLQLKTSLPERMEPGLTMMPARFGGGGQRTFTMALDAAGTVRWYIPRAVRDIRRLADGTYLGHVPDNRSIVTLDAWGRFTGNWHSQRVSNPPPGSVFVDTEDFHHDVFPMPDGNLLTLTMDTRVVENFPTSETNPNAPTETAQLRDDPILEFARDGTIVNQWSLVDMLNPRRIGYDSLRFNRNDWAHANSVFYDAADDSVIVSIRHQDAVIKFSRASGELTWILANHNNWGPELEPFLLQPLGEDFQWQYHQHAAKVLPNGNILLHDNGNFRASPPDPKLAGEENYTRAVEFAIDEEAMTITEVWEYGREAQEVLYSPTRGDADVLEQTDHVLITYADVRFIDGVSTDTSLGRVMEVDRDGEPVFDLTMRIPGKRSWVYRSERIATLYPPEYTVTSLPFLPGDYTGDGVVDAADYTVWRDQLGSAVSLPNDLTPHAVGDEDYEVWKLHFGRTLASGGPPAGAVVCEPVSSVLLLSLGLLWMQSRRCTHPGEGARSRTTTTRPRGYPCQ